MLDSPPPGTMETSESLPLAGQVAVVTGGGRGIGHAIALRLAADGARVAVVSRSEANAQRTADEINQAAGQTPAARAYGADVSDPAAITALGQKVQADFDRIDILVNNAGVTRDGLSLRMSTDDWDTVLDTNLKGAFFFIQAFQRTMLRQRRGRIVNISSVSGLVGNAGQTNYAASKAGLIGLTKSLARELASRNITVNAVAPGFIVTDMTDSLPEETKKAVVERIPLGRFGRVEDIAAAVAFLAGPEAAYITGQVLTVDGGMVM
jgi:3-oxoacyl-[acyl-carrier protein] reductase